MQAVALLFFSLSTTLGITNLSSLNSLNLTFGFNHHTGLLTFLEQHGENIFCRLVAKQFAVFALVIGDAMTLYQFNKLPLVVAIERRDTEVRVVAEIVFWGDVEIGEIAAATPRHKNFFAHFVAAVEN